MTKLMEVLVSQKTSSGNGGGSSSTKTRPDGFDHLSAPFASTSPAASTVAPSPPSSSSAVPHAAAAPFDPTIRAFTLSDESRLAALKFEMDSLLTRAQARKALDARDAADRTIPPSTTAPAPASPAPTAPVSSTPVAAPAAAPIAHPFAGARDAAYAPPQQPNFGIPPPKGPVYRTNAPVYSEKDAHEVFKASLDAPVTITQRQLLSIAPEVRAHMRDETTSRRGPPKDKASPVQQLFHEVDSALPFPADSAFGFETLEEQSAEDARRTSMFDSLPASFLIHPSLPILTQPPYTPSLFRIHSPSTTSPALFPTT
ncbi:hypothetical protein C8R43DRAFT_951758 [Mycena crocata]|nr:hypothetical protein C8R43DRAFT_951758 [Mycena crocata]